MKLNWSTILVLTTATGMTLACGNKKKKDDSGTSETPTEQQPPAKEEEKTTEEETKTPENTALYQPVNVPATFSLAFPGSLAIDTGGGAALCLQGEPCGDIGGGDGVVYDEPAPEAEAPSKDESHGLSELRFQLDGIRQRVEDYTQQFSAVDTVISANKADCDDGCEITGAKAKISKEMVNLMIANAGGKEAYSTEELAELETLVGIEYDIGDVKVEHPASDPAGFTTIITITQNAGENKHEVTLAFAKAEDKFSKVRIKDHSEGSFEPMSEAPADATVEAPMGLVGEAQEVQTYTSNFQLDFDAVALALSVGDDSDWGDYKYKNSFKFAADAAKAAKHGTTFSVVIDSSSNGGSGYAQETTGFADDDGAFLQTIYSYDVTTPVMTFSETVADAHRYELFLGNDVTVEALNADPYAFWSQGSVDYYGSYYWGMLPVPAAGEFKLFEVTYPEPTAEATEWKPVYSATTLTLTSISATTTRVSSGYSEQVDAQGKLVAYCWFSEDKIVGGKLTGTPECSTGWNDESAYAEAYDSYTGEDGGFEVKGAVVASITGTDIATLKGDWFYVVRHQDDINAFATSLNAAWFDGVDNGAFDQVIGDGSYFGENAEEDVNASTEVNAVYFVNFFGDTSEAATAQMLVYRYDTTADAYSFVPVSGTISAEVQ